MLITGINLNRGSQYTQHRLLRVAMKARGSGHDLRRNIAMSKLEVMKIYWEILYLQMRHLHFLEKTCMIHTSHAQNRERETETDDIFYDNGDSEGVKTFSL